jgi:hypothetical protein
MSSGKIEGNFFKNIEIDSIFNESVIFTDQHLQKSNYSKSKSYRNGLYKDINHNSIDPYEKVTANHFDLIQKIHSILKNSQDLTQKQKYDYCKNQRFFMKLYLKRISDKL